MSAARIGLLFALALGTASCDGSPQPPELTPRPPEPEAPPPAEPPPSPPRDVPAAIVAPPITADCALPPSSGRRFRTHTYARPPSGALRLDLVTPEGDGPHPFVAVFHGGGWSAGERGHLRDELTRLASLGYAAAAVSYRLVDQGARNRFPTQVADARCAIRYLRSHAPQLGLDPDRAAALGYSAGAHLAMMLAVAGDADGLDLECEDQTTSPAVSLAIAYFGPADLRPSARYDDAADRIINRMLGANRRREPERAALASPIAHVGGIDGAVMLVHGTVDGVVPVEQSRMMRAALARAGVPVQLVEVRGGSHGFRLFGRSDAVVAARCTSLAFLDAALRTPRDASRTEGAPGSPP